MAQEASTPVHALSPDQAMERLESTREGLGDDEARGRLAKYGPNALRATKPRSAWRILLGQLRSVVVLLLFAAAAVSLIMRDMLDAAAIGAVLLINTALGFVTELRARRAMESLLRLQAPRAVVVRARRTREIDAREIVPGDVIEIEQGQLIAADARVIETSDLRTIEAALTGESMPVTKTVDAVADDAPLAERADMLYQGTTVADGRARALVVATGADTELGRIGEMTGAVREERTPLERRLDALGRRLVWLALGTAGVVAGVAALRGFPLSEMIETGIALAIAAVPEGLPAVATIALAVGVRRMARRKALIRRLPSAESLGSVTVICTDKTGTLTAGEMTANVLSLPDREIEITGAGYQSEGKLLHEGREIDAADAQVREALKIGMLVNHAELAEQDGRISVRGDPTEGALLVAAQKAGLERDRLLDEEPQSGEVPFSSERMLMATFHESDGIVAYVKGAPQRIVELCTRSLSADGEKPLDDAGRERLLEQNRELASRGLRVLALARGRVASAEESALKELTFVGLVGMMDPAAEGVKETIHRFREAGIRTVMITGDQKLTAEAVARDLGILAEDDEVLDGRTMGELSDEDLAARVEHVGAFSRVDPKAKLEIVTAYQNRGEIVAVFGDGVNDAPALKKSDVGVAMGLRGTDVAKDAAAVVLQDDRFSTIGAAVEQGRVIFDNIRKFVFYLFSCNLAEVLVVLLATVAGLPLPLLPLQILWLNIVTDTFPALSLAVEPAEHDVMQRPPRDPQEAIFSASFLRSIAWYASLITLVTLAAFWIALDDTDTASPRALTMSFMTLALAQTFHLGNARSSEQVLTAGRAFANPVAIGAVVLVVLLQVAAVHFAPLARILRTQPLEGRDWLICVALALVPAIVGQVSRWLSAKRSGRAATATAQP